jgi:hypothetical protein
LAGRRREDYSFVPGFDGDGDGAAPPTDDGVLRFSPVLAFGLGV